jgi:quercetin dioxygenase-like cupin family protein
LRTDLQSRRVENGHPGRSTTQEHAMNAPAPFPGSSHRPLPLVAGPQTLVWFDTIPGERLAIRLRGTDTGGACTVVESLVAPGTATPIHSHREYEAFLVLDGVVAFSLDGRESDAAAGTTISIPAHMPHGWRNRTDRPARLFAVFAPGGIEDMFERLAGKAPDEVARLAAAYGTRVLGPPMP